MRIEHEVRNTKTNSRLHGKKIQEDALILIEEAYHQFPHQTFTNIIQYIKQDHPIPVPTVTLRRWWKEYENTGLYPYENMIVKKKI